VLCALSLGTLAGTAGGVGTTSSTVMVTDDAAGVVAGGSFTFTVTVSGSSGTPTGTVDWSVSGPSAVTCASSTLDGSGTGTCLVTGAEAGTYSATASYEGDDNYAPGSGSDPGAAVGLAPSTTSVTDDAAGVVAGGTFTFTAAVSGGAGIPTGSVTWSASGPSAVSCAPSTLDPSGKGTCTVSDARAGTYSASATYSGDTDYLGSSGSDTTATVGTTSSTTTVTDDASGAVAGGTFTFTATVTGSAGTPTGTVDWSLSGPSAVSCAPSTLDPSGEGTCTVSDARAGTYSATAAYGGAGNYAASSGSDTTASVGKAPSTTTVTDDAAGVVAGGTFSFTATVTGSAGTPTGTVDWSVSGPSAVSCAPSTLDPSGKGTCTVSDARVGTYSATASYGGDSDYHASSGSDTTASVGLAPSTTSVTDNAAGVVYKGTFTFTAMVSGGAGTTPTGTVTWSVSGPSAVTCANSTLDTSGKGTCTVSVAGVGTYAATATYTGDTVYGAGSGSDTTATVGQAPPTPPTIGNLPASGKALFGGAYTASVTGTNGDGVKYVTSNSTGVCTVSGDLTVTYVGVGTCSLTAQVGAGTNYLAASGGAQSFTVGPAPPSAPTVTNIPGSAVEFAGFTADVATNGDGTTAVVSNTPGVCSVESDGLTVLFTTTGACSVTASVGPGVDYQGASGVPQTFQIGPAPRGYWLVGSDGGIFSFGSAAFHGSMGGVALQRPVVGITPTITRSGYWLVASDGGIFSFGDATFFGSVPGLGINPAGSGLPHSLDAPIVGMVPSTNRRGYFMVASDGGVFAFGDAKFEGSCPGIGGCAGTAVAVMPDHTGNGYWLVTNTGGVYSFGDAPFYGAPGTNSVPVVNAVATPDGMGYWVLYANGVVANYGDAVNFGAPVGYVNSFNPANTIFPTADGKGYWVASMRGDVFSYGNAPWLGSMSGKALNGEIIAGFGF
jgi:Big-like domain-containing protein